MPEIRPRDWGSPEWWGAAVGQVLTILVLLGVFSTAQEAELNTQVSALGGAVAAAVAAFCAILAVVRRPPAPPDPPPPPPAPPAGTPRGMAPPRDGLGRFPAALVACLLLGACAQAQTHTSSGRPLESSGFTPAPAKTLASVRTDADLAEAVARRHQCCLQIGLFNRQQQTPQGRSSGADEALLSELRGLRAEVARLSGLIEGYQRERDRPLAAPGPQAPAPIIVYPPLAPRQEMPPGGAPRQELPGNGAPRQELPGNGAPRQELPPAGTPRQEIPGGGTPRQELPGAAKPMPTPGTAKPFAPAAGEYKSEAPPPARGMMTYTATRKTRALYRSR